MPTGEGSDAGRAPAPHGAPDPLERLGGALERPRAATALLGLAACAFAVVSLWVTRGAGFFVDEMKFFTTDAGFGPGSLLAPVNGHLCLVQRIVLGLDFRLFGAGFVLVRVVSVVGVVLVAVLLAVLVRRRVGAAAGLAAGTLILSLGAVWELTFVPSGVGVSFGIAGGLGALLAVERADRAGDLAACGLLVLSGAAYTIGPAFMLGALVLLLARPRGRRRAWVALVPLGLYLAWWVWARVGYVPPPGEASEVAWTNLLGIPAFAAGEAAAVAGVLFGVGRPLGDEDPYVVFTTTTAGVAPVLAALVAVGVALRVRAAGARPALWALLVVLGAWWAALGLGAGPGRTPETVRYAYAGVVLVVLVAAEAFRGGAVRGRTAVVLLGLVALALPANVGRLREGVALYRDSTSALAARLLAVELARDVVDPALRAQAGPATALQVTGAGPYLAAVDRLGASPALAPSALGDLPEPQAAELDRGLVAATRAGLRTADRVPEACRTTPAGPDGRVRLELPPGTDAVVRSAAPAPVAARRFARDASTVVPLGELAAGRPTRLALPRDRADRPWSVEVVAPRGLRVCASR